MSLPFSFSTVTEAEGSWLDSNFQAVGILGTLPCTVTGTSALTLTPMANTPTLTAYSSFVRLSGIVAVTNTGPVTAVYSGLTALPVYKDTAAGPVALVAGDMIAGNAVVLTYDPALGGGVGGFHAGVPQGGSASSLGLTATGTNQAGALVLTTQISVVATTPSGSGVVLPAITNELLFVYNRGSNTLDVYPPTGAAIDANSVNAPVTISAGGVGRYMRVSATQYYTS